MESKPIIGCFITFKLLLFCFSGMLVRLICNPDADEPTLTNNGADSGGQYVCMYVCIFKPLNTFLN